MPTRPELLDLFGGQGGAGAGYTRAGWDVTGVDAVARHGRYYPGRFVHADALDYLADHGHEYQAVHASPPCQRFTHGLAAQPDLADRHPDYLAATRYLLAELGTPWVIENVPRAPLRDPLTLCGSMFGLTATDDDGTALVLRRHRLFESPVPLTAPHPCRHRHGEQVAGVYGGARKDKHDARYVRHGGYVPRRAIQAELMGVDWPTTGAGLQQMIPPAYTEWIGAQLIEAVT